MDVVTKKKKGAAEAAVVSVDPATDDMGETILPPGVGANVRTRASLRDYGPIGVRYAAPVPKNES